MSKLNLGMNKTDFYQVMAIALAVSLVISWAGFYAYYLSVQPLIKPPEQPLKEEKPFRPYQVQGIISVYKNGILVYQGPDVLTNSFYDYLPFLLGNVCTATDGPTSCPAGSWADTVFTAAPPALSCSVTISGTSITAASSRVPIVGAFTNALLIGVSSATTTPSPSDCVLSPTLMSTASAAVYSPYLNNHNNPPAPCPNPTAGCVQISASFTSGTTVQLTRAMLYAKYSKSGTTDLYTLIAHDAITSVTLNPQDTLTIVYTFVFPEPRLNPDAYNDPQGQGGIAPIFGQCLARQHFNVPVGVSGPYRICLDNVKLQSAKIRVWTPFNPCSNTETAGPIVENGNNKITIEASAASKYVRIYAPMSADGSGIQFVQYNIQIAGVTSPDAILKASQACSVATQQSFVAGQTVGLQLTWP